MKTRAHVLTYAGLNATANRIARAVLDEGSRSAEPVALLMDQGAPLLAAILGILKAGKLYIPLDPSHPLTRLADVLEDSRVRLIAADGRNAALATRLAAQGRRRVLNVDEIDPRASADDPKLPLSPNRGAYVFYTSGSTGTPKGVVDDHRNVLHNIMRYTNTLHVSPDDRLDFDAVAADLDLEVAPAEVFQAAVGMHSRRPSSWPERIARAERASWRTASLPSGPRPRRALCAARSRQNCLSTRSPRSS